MKIINDWPSLNKLNISAADQPVLANGVKLYFTYSLGRFVYYRLENLVTYGFLNREDDYFNESD